MRIDKENFKKAVYQIINTIPAGRVMTYGQIAALIGYPRAAQMVGWTLHWAKQKNVPYQRVVNRFGGLAGGYPNGSRDRHKEDLEGENVEVGEDYTVDLTKYLYKPKLEFVVLKQKSREKLERI